jgi:3-phosphoshikimate 1-carboxyvinyltransferase
MKEIKPIKRIEGTIRAPPSKSYTHRAFFLGLLSEGRTKIENSLVCDDTYATLQAVRGFGANAGWDFVESDGRVKPANINVKESGTTARIVIALSALGNGESVIDGDEGIRKRPMKPLLDVLKEMGVAVTSHNGRLPVRVRGFKDVDKELKKKHLQIPGNISSQFVTALLFLGAKLGLEIEIVGELVSKPYVDITLRCLSQAGVRYDIKDNVISVKKGIKTSSFSIPGDYSSAAFFLTAGAIFGKIRVLGLDMNDVQGDMVIVKLLERFGARVVQLRNYIEVEKRELNGIEVDCSDFPDLFPILAVLGAYSKGETLLRAPQLRYKESDRIRSMALNLGKMGASIKEFDEGIQIQGGKLKGAVLEPHNDHRIAMALAIAALGAETKSKILNESCIKKSYPDFFKHLNEVLCK